MYFLDPFAVVFRPTLTVFGMLDEERVMCISSWVALRLEKSIEVPERALYEPIGRHLREAHFEEDLFELLSD